MSLLSAIVEFFTRETVTGETYDDQAAVELVDYFKAHPTGDIVTQKKRRIAIQVTQREEDQIIADRLLDKVKFPKSEAMMGKDVFGKHVKIYLDGPTVFDDDGAVVDSKEVVDG